MNDEMMSDGSPIEGLGVLVGNPGVVSGEAGQST